MEIKVVSAVATGSTLLSSFDSALIKTGVNNNLLVLSSVIPKGSTITRKENVKADCGQIGDRLYVVKADIRSDKPGQVIAAALGWYFMKDGTGTMVEHEIEGFSEEDVNARIRYAVKSSIQDICEFRNEHYDESQLGIEIAICKVDKLPACALTLAVFKAEPW